MNLKLVRCKVQFQVFPTFKCQSCNFNTEIRIFKSQACDSLKDEDTNKSVLFANHHMTFHSLLGELSGNPLLHKMMNQVIIKSFMIYNAQRGWARGIDRDSHRKLVIDLFKADSQEKIESIMRAHVKRGLQDEIEVLHFNQQ